MSNEYKTNPNEPAHPHSVEDISKLQFNSCGLTKREYFAAAALQGLLTKTGSINNFENFTEFAVDYADALIKKLNETKAKE